MQDVSFFTAITMAVFDTSTLSGTYQSMNGTGFSNDIKVMKIYNGSNVGITVSYDNGGTDQDFFPAGATQILDLQTNHADNSSYSSGILNGRKGQLVMGKGSAGVGNFYIIGYR